MIDDMSQMIKEKLLEDLIAKMSDGAGERMKPKGMGVEVQAPDKEGLADGLSKAKDLLAKGSAPEAEESGESGGDSDDEHRLMQLLDEDDEDEK